MASLHLRFSDEHGREIPSLAGGNTGIGDPRGVHIRGDYHAAVPSGTNDLCIRVDEIQIETIEVDPDDPGMARPVVAERTRFGWDLTDRSSKNHHGSFGRSERRRYAARSGQSAMIVSIQVGVPTRLEDERGRWETSFVREPSPERRRLFFTHLEGNIQADTANHGKPGQAVLVYAAAHYPAWREELGRPEIGPGGFGENFTVDGLSEATVCIGDTFTVGDARIQVTGPRYPCTKIGRRWGTPTLTSRVAETGRTGWYCRVVREGSIEPVSRWIWSTGPIPRSPSPSSTTSATAATATSRRRRGWPSAHSWRSGGNGWSSCGPRAATGRVGAVRGHHAGGLQRVPDPTRPDAIGTGETFAHEGRWRWNTRSTP